MPNRDPDQVLSKLTNKNDFEQEPVRLTEDHTTGDRFLIYSTDKGAEVQLRYEGDDLWMSQAQIADLYEVSRTNISLHLNNIYTEGELNREATSKESLRVQPEGGRQVTRSLYLYNLDAIISVGYRVSSKQGTQIRKWATQKLVQFATKGFVVDAERLKDPDNHDHFKELREIIRDIRASEANVYKEVRAICALCSDYEMYDDKAALDKFIKNNERPLLNHAGKISKKVADSHVTSEYKIFIENRRKFLDGDGGEE